MLGPAFSCAAPGYSAAFLITSKEGITYVDVELVCLKFDEFLKEYKLSIHQLDGKRLLRWMRHIRDHQGEWNMDDIDKLEQV